MEKKKRINSRNSEKNNNNWSYENTSERQVELEDDAILDENAKT